MRTTLVVTVLAVSLGCSGRRAEQANARGRECADKGDTACAVKEYAEAVRLAPEVGKFHYNLGRAYARIGHFDMASKQFSEALRIDPGDVEASRLLTIANAAIDARTAQRN